METYEGNPQEIGEKVNLFRLCILFVKRLNVQRYFWSQECYV